MERHIEAALQSVQAQTYRGEIEILVIENGSTDAGPQIVAGLAAADPGRLKLYVMDGEPSLSRARNAGLAQARHSWVALLDADDEWLPEKLERQMAFVERTERETGREIAAVGTSGYHIGVDGRRIGLVDMLGLDAVEEFDQLHAAGELLFLSNSSVLLRRDRVIAVGGYDSTYDGAEDLELYSRLADAGGLILNFPERLFLYRVHDQTYSTGGFFRQQADLERIVENTRRRRRREKELSREEYAARLAEAPLTARLNRWRVLHSRRDYRMAGGAFGAGRWLRGLLRFIRASMLAPEIVTGRLKRQVWPRIVRSRPVDAS